MTGHALYILWRKYNDLVNKQAKSLKCKDTKCFLCQGWVDSTEGPFTIEMAKRLLGF
jgi:hypothetical protein